MFSEPARTPLDLNIPLFFTRCRVHPMFWLISLAFGYFSAQNIVQAGREQMMFNMVLWMICTFISILIHEMGHVLAGMMFGEPGRIVLHSMGGLAIGNYGTLNPWQRIVIALAGPGAGFLLLVLVICLDPSFWNHWVVQGFDMPRYLQIPGGLLRLIDGSLIHRSWYTQWGRFLFAFLIIQNLFWNLLNLIPIFPLDGGRVVREICMLLFHRGADRLAVGFSFFLSGALAAYSAFKIWVNPGLPYPPVDPMFEMIFFGILAFQNYTMLRQIEAQDRYYGNDDHGG